jgi:hypothetical protein
MGLFGVFHFHGKELLHFSSRPMPTSSDVALHSNVQATYLANKKRAITKEET